MWCKHPSANIAVWVAEKKAPTKPADVETQQQEHTDAPSKATKKTKKKA